MYLFITHETLFSLLTSIFPKIRDDSSNLKWDFGFISKNFLKSSLHCFSVNKDLSRRSEVFLLLKHPYLSFVQSVPSLKTSLGPLSIVVITSSPYFYLYKKFYNSSFLVILRDKNVSPTNLFPLSVYWELKGRISWLAYHYSKTRDFLPR